MNGTEMVYQAACAFSGQEPTWRLEEALPPPEVPEVVVNASGHTLRDLRDAVRMVYDIREDDALFREGQASSDDPGRAFDGMRNQYRVRREFRYTRASGAEELVDALQALGFS